MPPAHAHTSSDRAALVQALSSVSEGGRRIAAERFLEGLSSDELRYIADFVGASCLEPDLKPGQTRALIAECIERYQSMAGSRDGCCHKMILLLEFLSLNTVRSGSFRALGGVA